MINKIAHDQILELNLSRPPVNALSPELVQTLSSEICQAPAEGFRAIVISGQEGIFSAGLDVPELLQLDRDGLSRFWQDFFRLLQTVACSSIPTVAAVTGHSPAGGAVIALYCDYRVMSRGNFKLGLNEVQVGLVVPEVIQRSLMRLVGPHQAERMMVSGELLDPEQAHRIGFINQLTDPGDTVDAALEWCRRHIALPAKAMLETRKIARRQYAELFQDFSQLGVEEFVCHWFHDSTQQVLNGLVESLKKGK